MRLRGQAHIVGLALGLSLPTGCRGQTAQNGDLVGAGIFAGLAAVSSIPLLARDRGSYSCPETCPPEYTCNRITGLCDREPCGGHCGSGQQCSSTGDLETCVAMPSNIPPIDSTTIDLGRVLTGIGEAARAIHR